MFVWPVDNATILQNSSSKNGSPVDPIDEGALVATVTKKRRGNAIEGAAANFDINVGDGRYISLNDPAGVQNLDDDMKTSALSQLKVLQDQMASLMKQLTTTESSKKWSVSGAPM